MTDKIREAFKESYGNNADDDLFYAFEEGYKAARSSPQWISVDDRLPERYTEVMVWPIPSDQTRTAEFGLMSKESSPCWHYSQYETNYGWEERECNVTHWMPLPAAPSPDNT